MVSIVWKRQDAPTTTKRDPTSGASDLTPLFPKQKEAPRKNFSEGNSDKDSTFVKGGYRVITCNYYTYSPIQWPVDSQIVGQPMPDFET